MGRTLTRLLALVLGIGVLAGVVFYTAGPSVLAPTAPVPVDKPTDLTALQLRWTAQLLLTGLGRPANLRLSDDELNTMVHASLHPGGGNPVQALHLSSNAGGITLQAIVMLDEPALLSRWQLHPMGIRANLVPSVHGNKLYLTVTELHVGRLLVPAWLGLLPLRLARIEQNGFGIEGDALTMDMSDLLSAGKLRLMLKSVTTGSGTCTLRVERQD